jgi:hypothetical protein
MARSALAIALILVSGAVVVASLDEHDPAPREIEPSAKSGQCPGAAQVFTRAGLPEPNDFGPSCPEPAELEAAIAEASVPASDLRAARAIRRAAENGVIEEGQNPRTYPQLLQRFVD